MLSKTLRDALTDRTRYAVLAELTGGPGFSTAPLERFLAAANQDQAQRIGSEFDFVGITLPQSPGGTANIEPADVLATLKEQQLLEHLDVVPHITCKDHNSNALHSALIGYRSHGVESVLALTGDKPASAKGVFELEGVGLLDRIQQINRQALLKAKPDQWDALPQFFPGAAVSPFKYTEASQMQQYYKMEKKIHCGAEFLITQLGWDWRKSLELMQYLRDRHIDIPVIGNVYFLTTQTSAPRLMHSGKLPGCYVSDALLKQLQSETVEQHTERAAQQVAMYRSLGTAGVDIGGVHDYDTFVHILARASEIGDQWAQYQDNLYWPADKVFYLYNEQGQQVSLSPPKRKFKQKLFNTIHRSLFEPTSPGYHLFKGMVRVTGAARQDSVSHHLFAATEKSIKHLTFDCDDCGDCYLMENFGYCTMGGCEKGLSNAPCGDSTVDGYCGNNALRRCTGELVYEAGVTVPDGRERLRTVVQQPRDPALRGSSSWINYLFGKDHTRARALLTVADAINAFNPKTRQALQLLDASDCQALSQDSGALRFLKALIQSQAEARADYIGLNLDPLNGDIEELAQTVSVYVAMVRRWGRSVPVSIESAHTKVLIAGLKAWYNTDHPVKAPMIRASQPDDIAPLLKLKEEYDFSLTLGIGTEVIDRARSSANGSAQLQEQTQSLFEQAVKQGGFKPQQIVFDLVVRPLAADRPEANTPGYTHMLFETIKRIKEDRTMRGVRTSVTVELAAVKLPGRSIGVCRAYVALAMQYGLGACVADAQRHYGQLPADPHLILLAKAYAEMDGSADKAQRAQQLMDAFCMATGKPKG